MSYLNKAHLVLSLNRALWGEVGEGLRAVTFHLAEKQVILRFYVDGTVSDDMAESASVVETEFLSDLPHDVRVSSQIVRIDMPERIKFVDEELVFQRKE